MKRLPFSVQLLGVSLVLALSACGGSNGGGGGGGANFPFDGSWVGTWDDSQADESGTIRVDIDSRGVMLGSMFNSSRSLHGTLTGSVNSVGVFSGTIDYPPPNSDITLDGTLDMSKGHLVGQFDEHVGPLFVGAGTLDCVPEVP